MRQPLVSIVMPSLNQAQFLPEAIESVLAQDYPRLELIVMDGGSTDGSIDILESYRRDLCYVSERDGGQADAINAGLRDASGEIVAWLNADDRYLPGAVRSAVRALAGQPEAGMVYGYGELIDECGAALGPFYQNRPFDLWSLIFVTDFIMQPAAFLRASSMREAGNLDPDLHFGLDWDLWIRMACRWPVASVPEIWAQTREHACTKTARGGLRRLRELRGIMARHGATGWPPAAVAYGLDTLRKRWPVVFGPGSRAEALVQRGRLWPWLWSPLHGALGRYIDRRLEHGQGIYADGWAAPRARAAVAWCGEPGGVTVRGEVAARGSGRRFRLEVTAAGGAGSVVRDAPGPFEVVVPVAASAAADPRALEIEMRASPDFRLAGDRRRLAFRLTGVEFRARSDLAGHPAAGSRLH